jgi:fluoroquinolone resistance protein
MHPSGNQIRSYAKETIAGMDWSGQTIREQTFDECRFENCRFSKTTFVQCQFRDCMFRSCDLTAAKLPGSVFLRVAFASSKVAGIMWPETREDLFRVEFKACVLSFSSFSGMDLSNSAVEDCTAIDVDFQEANLSHVSFAGTNLQDSKFLRSNLAFADFSNATRYSLDPSKNTLRKTMFAWPEAISLLGCFDIVWK